LKPYLYIAKTKILSELAYRFDVISSVTVQCLVVIATSFFWIAVYGGRQSAQGVTKEQMLTYTIMSAMLACIFTANVENRVIQSVRKGNVALDMLKPISVFGIYLAEDIGATVIALCQNAAPLLLISCLLIQVPVPSSVINFLLFLLSAVLSYLINWLITACFSMMSFFVISIGPFHQIKNVLIRILSGSIIPLWFFPESLQGVLRFLPFMYIYQLPLSIYIGRLGPLEILAQTGLQLAWLLVLFGVFKLIQKKVFSNVMIQGG
jgi:ABC-2 type transport system permease protein